MIPAPDPEHIAGHLADTRLEEIARALHAALEKMPGLEEIAGPDETGPEELWIDSTHWEIDMLFPEGMVHVVVFGPGDDGGFVSP